MAIENKEEKLRNFALSCFNDKENKADLENLLYKLGLSAHQVVQSYVDYDLDIFAYSNEIYDPLAMRMVMHIHNLLHGSWHIDRQNAIYNFVNLVKPSSIMDVGFGIPSLYVRKILSDNDDVHVTLSDFSDSAMKFASLLLDSWNPHWNSKVNLVLEDMSETSLHPPKSDIYLFQDSVEHVPNPTLCLTNFVKNSHPEAKFLLSLPIGPIVPMHYIAWDSDVAAQRWLQECGLDVIEQRKIYVNPEVDLFAEQLDFHCTNIVVLCQKSGMLPVPFIAE